MPGVPTVGCHTLNKGPPCVDYRLRTCGQNTQNGPSHSAGRMSNVEQDKKQVAIQTLKQEISKLEEHQIAAEKVAAPVGMTSDDSGQYKERHSRIKRLAKKLALLEREQGAHDEQK